MRLSQLMCCRFEVLGVSSYSSVLKCSEGFMMMKDAVNISSVYSHNFDSEAQTQLIQPNRTNIIHIPYPRT